jgi:hypothetical protein
VSNVNPTEAIQFAPLTVKVIPCFCGILNIHITVKGKGFPGEGFFHEALFQLLLVDSVY